MPSSRPARSPDDLVHHVAEKLSALRRRSGITRERLAEMLGTAPTNLAQMLAGNENMTLETVERIAMALGYRLEVRAIEDAKGPTTPPAAGRYARVRPPTPRRRRAKKTT